MTMEFFLGAAALINLHHFNVNFEEGWGQRDERAAFGSRLGRGALMYRVWVCVRPGSEGRPFACKLRQTLHVQIIHPGWGKLCYCNGLRITHVSRGVEALLTRLQDVRGSVCANCGASMTFRLVVTAVLPVINTLLL